MDEVIKGKIKVITSLFEGFKKRLSTFENVAKEFKDSVIFLNLQISDFDEDFKSAKLLHSEIIAGSSEGMPEYDSYMQKKVFDAISNIYFKHSTTLHGLLKIAMSGEELNATAYPQAANFSTYPNANSYSAFDMNWSYIQGSVPNFDGSYEKWTEFMDSYKSYVHDNDSLSDCAKLKILNSLLKGDALKVVKREFGTLKACDYEQIWEKLTQRYNHKKTIVYAYFQELFFQSSFEKETASNLKTIYDVSYDSVQALKNLGLATEQWGDILLFLVYSKLPFRTKSLWDERQTPDKLPVWKEFLDFLESRFRMLEGLEVTVKGSGFNSKSSTSAKKLSTFQTSNNNESQAFSVSKITCKCCQKGSHALRKCYKFKKLKVQERIKLVKSLNYCSNCFSFSHELPNCTSNYRCENCNDKHNTLLCTKPKKESISESTNSVGNPVNVQNIQSTSDGRFSRVDPSTLATSLVSESGLNECTIFPTALVKVLNRNGQHVVLRAMIDNCSDASYITDNAAKKLQLSIQNIELQVSGLGNSPTAKTTGIVSFNIQSINHSFIKTISAYVLPLISPSRPSKNFTLNENSLQSLNLADPNYNQRSRIDLLLGGSVDAAIQKGSCFKLDQDNIIIRDTQLGWLVSGSVSELNCFSATVKSDPQDSNSNKSVFESLNDTLKRFWEVEELPNQRNFTSEEKLCEHIFHNTTVRTDSGRYSVSLPFKDRIDGFVNMRTIAMSRFSQLERKLLRNPDLSRDYVKCMEEYIELNHMSPVNPVDFQDAYYIPHHCVIKASSTTTKLRVVYDASAKDSNSQSLNDSLLNGPRLQFELLDHLSRFRTFKIAFTADIAKMYRQIEINPNDRKFQLILWRSNGKGEILTYALNTVTFGTKSAPYLAVKTLMRLSEDEKLNFPEGSLCLREGFYVDDCIYGSDSVEEAKEIQSQLIAILESGGFHIRKWSSNHTELTESVPESDRETDTVREFDSKASVKTLGVQWCPIADCFQYKISFDTHPVPTKRNILSDIAKIFDPLGWISPCIITAKLLIQQLWVEKIDWDMKVQDHLGESWENLRSGLAEITEHIRVPRWLHTKTDSIIEVHGFSDASAKAYAAAIYIKATTDDQIVVNLLCSKTKVAPLKTISLPRLELMGAVMLAKMINHLKPIWKFPNITYHYWSDSQITLAWIKDDPQKRTVFVANRVAEIQSLSPCDSWRYVESKSNPADLGTRGIPPADLVVSSLWWHGPQFLPTFSVENIPQSHKNVNLPPEDNVKSKIKAKGSDAFIHSFLSHKTRNSINEISSNLTKFSIDPLNKFSTLCRLVRVVAFCLRVKYRSNSSFITPIEYERALLIILRIVQEQVYAQELSDIQSDGISKQSPIYSLNPFVNNCDGLLRVSGRLENADHISYDQKHPIILPYSHIITELIVRHAHVSTLHGTEQQTSMLICQRYHIIRCKRLVKSVINNCVKCFRFRCATQSQLMGQIPRNRITPNRPFLNSGVDFAGPFDIKKFKGRCQTTYKSYFAIFVCFATKATHLEVVIDLSSQAFIAAYRRFISRRGICKNLYSDCGTNFVGSKGAITRTRAQVEDQWNEYMAKELAEFHTMWHFNPPGAPHFGGLWEAGVKSVKHHLKRIIGSTRLTYDEFETVLIQTEACLNSRPLCELRKPTESIVITPAHFLIQDCLLALPEDNLATKNVSTLDRWNIVQQIVQKLWVVWNQEYLNTLRQRKTWRDPKENIQIDDVVVIKDSNVQPASWLLARVLEVFPGKDQLVRVVLLKTKNTTLKRPISKICKLPIQKDETFTYLSFR